MFPWFFCFFLFWIVFFVGVGFVVLDREKIVGLVWLVCVGEFEK